MIIQIDRRIGANSCIHVPEWLVLNWFTAWAASCAAKFGANITLRASDIRQLISLVRKYEKENPDFRLTEVYCRNGDCIAVWV